MSDLFPTNRIHVVPVSIPSYFKTSDKPKIPVVAIHTRNQMDSLKIAKSFYLQFPMYKWITFRELRGLSREDFANELGKACLSVWVDDASGFGTFPIESFECDTPIIGKVPNLIPDWMETTNESGVKIVKNNGIWTNTTTNIPELISNYLKAWLEDAIPEEFTKAIEDSKGQFTSEKQIKAVTEVYSFLVQDRIGELESKLNQETSITK